MSTTREEREFESTADHVLDSRWDFYPDMASKLGLHQYDGRLPDISPAALARRAQELEKQAASLERLDPAGLSRLRRLDHALLSAALRRELFELTELRTFETNPMDSIWHIELSHYVKRDYAPIDERIGGLTQALESVPPFLTALRDHLTRPLAAPVLEAAVEAYAGMASFYEKDLPEAVGRIDEGKVKQRLEDARVAAISAVHDFVGHLQTLQGGALQGSSTADFALGADKFLTMLRLGELVDLPLERLLEIGTVDLARNQERFRREASKIDPERSPREVMAQVATDHPSAESLIPETREMLEEMRQFLIDRDIVSVPSEVRCQTAETPRFMRWAFAAMDAPGPFETGADEAYYYVTPVEDDWSDEQKEEWLTSFNRASLQNISIHEAYPGHYVHFLHAKARTAQSKTSRVFGAYSFIEGWAHYAEEMMVEAGYAGDDPRLIAGQLGDALLRDCRYLCAIRMHTEGMSVEEATRFFVENAYMEELPARKEATRGAFDPMYLNYTLGKLMILKLREDFRREQGSAFSLKEFHDAFLSYGAPPMPLVRTMMLREPGGNVL